MFWWFKRDEQFVGYEARQVGPETSELIVRRPDGNEEIERFYRRGRAAQTPARARPRVGRSGVDRSARADGEPAAPAFVERREDRPHRSSQPQYDLEDFGRPSTPDICRR